MIKESQRKPVGKPKRTRACEAGRRYTGPGAKAGQTGAPVDPAPHNHTGKDSSCPPWYKHQNHHGAACLSPRAPFSRPDNCPAKTALLEAAVRLCRTDIKESMSLSLSPLFPHQHLKKKMLSLNPQDHSKNLGLAGRRRSNTIHKTGIQQLEDLLDMSRSSLGKSSSQRELCPDLAVCVCPNSPPLCSPRFLTLQNGDNDTFSKGLGE